MGWFDDQIEFRKKHERELLSDSFENIARSVTGRKIRSTLSDQEDVNDVQAEGEALFLRLLLLDHDGLDFRLHG